MPSSLRNSGTIKASSDGAGSSGSGPAFPAADYAGTTGTTIFDIGGNKYRLISSPDNCSASILVCLYSGADCPIRYADYRMGGGLRPSILIYSIPIHH